MEKRKLTKEDIDKVRDIEGFPIGSDEDIIALSDAPYYTACPNPFVEDFIKENGHPYDEETDNYHREPFASDVSIGKTGAIYVAHSYHTKVPYKAIMKYILHYTDPGDIVFDGFCGTGMTGVAAEACSASEQLSLISNQRDSLVELGDRKAIISDLSPAATFIANGYTKNIDPVQFEKKIDKVIKDCQNECGWMYKTKHNNQDKLFFSKEYGDINYIVWSDVLICPNCGEELVYWDEAMDEQHGKINDHFKCKKCGYEIEKDKCEKSQEIEFDNKENKIIAHARQVPTLIVYSYQGKTYRKKPDADDIALLEKIDKLDIPYWFPTDITPPGSNTDQPRKSHGINRVDQFYWKRSLYLLSKIRSELSNDELIVFTGILLRASKMNRIHVNNFFHGGGGWNAGYLKGTLYVPSLPIETNVIDMLRDRKKTFINALYEVKRNNSVYISTQSLTDFRQLPGNCIDYIFIDPPFGSNINYSELNFIWEAWLKVFTNNREEAIVNKTQHKSITEYQQLMYESLSECFRILKPGRWITIEFHNSKNAIWTAIQEAINKSGFVIADVRTLDKKQGSFKQVTTSSAVKQDLVISAYKPRNKFITTIYELAGSEETAWAFIEQHLANLPVVVDADNDGRIDMLAERQAYLLYDRMVAYHIMQGIPVPLDANDFYKGLDERFIKRDDMYFLPDQVNEYDTARIKMDVEPIQFELFVTNEKSAIAWLYQILSDDFGGPQTYAELQPKFMKEIKAVDKYEDMPELQEILEENFLQDDKGRWYIPDVRKEGDVAKLREKKLIKEFEGYMQSKGKLKLFRSEAIRAGFSKLWKEKNYQAIVDMAERLPEKTIQEDDKLLMYYDISLSRVQ